MKKLMKLNEFEDREFYQIPKWILNFIENEKIKAVDISVYMLAYDMARLSDSNGYTNKNNEVFFYLTHDKIQNKLNIGKNQSIASIKRLIEANLIVSEKKIRKATKYFIVNHFTDNADKNNSNLSKEKNTNFILSQSEKSVHYKSEINDSYRSDFNDYNNNNINNNKLNNNNIGNSAERNVSQEELLKKFKDKIDLLKNNSNISKFISLENFSLFFKKCSNEKILNKFFNILSLKRTKVLSINYFFGILKNLINDYKIEVYEETKKEEKRKAYDKKLQLENKIKEEQNNLRKKQIHDYESLPKDIKESIETKAVNHLAKTNPTTFEFINAFKDSSNLIYLSTIKDLAIEFMRNNSLQDIGVPLS